MLEDFLSNLGPVGWPLLIMSCVALALVLERLLTYLLLPTLSRKRVNAILVEIKEHRQQQQTANLCASLCSRDHCLSKGAAVLLSHADNSKAMREEIAGLWLMKQRQRLHAWLKGLMLIGVLSPMVGLLGTILGMITMFQSIALATGPVTPAVLAGGLWVAMYTTAFGLAIAIPSLAASHGFTIWANNYLDRMEFVLNHINLLLEGVNLHEQELMSNSKVVPFRERAA